MSFLSKQRKVEMAILLVVCFSFMALELALCLWMILEPQIQFILCFLEEDKS